MVQQRSPVPSKVWLIWMQGCVGEFDDAKVLWQGGDVPADLL